MFHKVPTKFHKVLIPYIFLQMKNTKQILTQIGITIVIIMIWFIIFDKKIWNNLLELEKKINLNENQVQTWNIFDINTFQDLITNNVEQASKSVVSIVTTKNVNFYFENSIGFGPWNIVEQETEVWWGSWIIGTKDGYIITSKHVIQDEKAEYTVVTQNGEKYKVDKIRFDPTLDIAILKIIDEKWNPPSDLQPAKFISINKEVKVWQFAIAIWNALSEYQNSVTLWIISAKNRQAISQNGNLYIWLYQTDASINAWNSGWPLLNIDWEVIWINTAINEFAKWIGFSLPVTQEFIDNSLASIQKNSKIIRPEIGFEYTDITKKSQSDLKLDLENWIYVKSIFSGSSVQLAWLLPGDIIIKINDNEINNELPFLFQYYSLKVEEKVDLTVIRNGDKKTIRMINTDKVDWDTDSD